MEADHMRKKYRSIRSSLLQDGVAYESTLKKLEDDLLKQESEIQHLEVSLNILLMPVLCVYKNDKYVY